MPDRWVKFQFGPGGHGSPEGGGGKAPARGTPRLDVGLELGHHAEVVVHELPLLVGAQVPGVRVAVEVPRLQDLVGRGGMGPKAKAKVEVC